MNEALIGHWTGTKLLNLSWLPNPEHLSEATLTIKAVAGANFLELTYTWSHEGVPQDGVLLVSFDPKSNKASAAWCDSWHQNTGLMLSQGEVEASGRVVLLGHYPAPSGPDWGWRTTLEHSTGETGDALELVMTNIAPDGIEELAVRASLTRATPA